MGIETDRLVVIPQGPVEVAVQAARKTPVIESHAMVGLEADRLVVVPQRALYVAFGPARKAPAEESIGIIGIETDRFVVIPQRTLYVAFGLAIKSPVEEEPYGLPRASLYWRVLLADPELRPPEQGLFPRQAYSPAAEVAVDG
jgi:hypothetical protein